MEEKMDRGSKFIAVNQSAPLSNIHIKGSRVTGFDQLIFSPNSPVNGLTIEDSFIEVSNGLIISMGGENWLIENSDINTVKKIRAELEYCIRLAEKKKDGTILGDIRRICYQLLKPTEISSLISAIEKLI